MYPLGKFPHSHKPYSHSHLLSFAHSFLTHTNICRNKCWIPLVCWINCIWVLLMSFWNVKCVIKGPLWPSMASFIRMFVMCLVIKWDIIRIGPRLNIKMSSYQYNESHCGDKMVVRLSYINNGLSYTGKMSSFYWIKALVSKRKDFIDLYHLNVKTLQ